MPNQLPPSVINDAGTALMRWSGSARGALAIAVLATLALAAPHLRAQAGPPFQTDDPTPVDLGHYEAYLFGTVDGTPVEIDSSGPAFEFNWGALPNIQLHAILPLGAVVPLNHPSAAPAGQGPATFGLTDAGLGVKFHVRNSNWKCRSRSRRRESLVQTAYLGRKGVRIVELLRRDGVYHCAANQLS